MGLVTFTARIVVAQVVGDLNLVQVHESMTNHHLVATSIPRSIDSDIIYDHVPNNLVNSRY
jgi:hypothetical protein